MTLSTGLALSNAGKPEGGTHFWILLTAGEVVSWIMCVRVTICGLIEFFVVELNNLWKLFASYCNSAKAMICIFTVESCKIENFIKFFSYSKINWRKDVPFGYMISSVLSCFTTFCLYWTILKCIINILHKIFCLFQLVIDN